MFLISVFFHPSLFDLLFLRLLLSFGRGEGGGLAGLNVRRSPSVVLFCRTSLFSVSELFSPTVRVCGFRPRFPAYLMGLDLPQEELDASIIGTIGDMDGPMPADSKGWTSLRRYLMGHTDETRQRFRDEVSERKNGTPFPDHRVEAAKYFRSLLSCCPQLSKIFDAAESEMICLFTCTGNALQLAVPSFSCDDFILVMWLVFYFNARG